MTTSIPQAQSKNASATATANARIAKRGANTALVKAKPAGKAAHVKKPCSSPRAPKAAKILDLLKRPGGVTLKQLIKATGWQAHSVRGFLSGTLGKKMGTPAESFKRADGERAYCLFPN